MQLNYRGVHVLAGLVMLWLLLADNARAAPFAYVASSDDNAVSVIDTASNVIVATIPTEQLPVGLAVSADGSWVYVANQDGRSITVIDAATNEVADTINIGRSTKELAVSPDGERVYVTNPSDAAVSVIDTDANSVIATIEVGNFPQGLAITPDGSRVYVANQDDDSVSVIDATANTLLDSNGDGTPDPAIGVGNGPDPVVVAPDGSRVYVGNSLSNSVSVIDTVSHLVVGPVEVGNGPGGLAVAPDGSRVYVANLSDDTVSVIDTATLSLLDSDGDGTPDPAIGVGNAPIALAVTPDGERVYVSNFFDDTVSVIDTTTLALLDSDSDGTSDPAIAVGGDSFAVGLAPRGPDLSRVTVVPGNPATLYAGTLGAGLFVSTDGGQNWVAASTGLTDPRITALAASEDGAFVYAGTRAKGVFRSTDGGASWQPVNSGLANTAVRDLVVLPGDGQTVIAGLAAGGGVFRSSDAGASWEAINDGLP